jgi:pimeloyl-ACP methyl ester carboxylesterase
VSWRFVPLCAAVGLVLTVIGGLFGPTVRAQEATPAAVAPPQSLLPTTWDEVAGQTAHVNGIDLYYEVYGSGEPLVLLHGGLGNGTYFRNQIPVFAAHYRVIVVDSRGHGRSTFDDQPITYPQMASDTLALLDRLAIAKASIVGWSDGAIVAIEIAMHHPERLTKVVAYGANYNPSGMRPDAFTNDTVTAYFGQAYADYQQLSPQPERWDALVAALSTTYAIDPDYTDEQLAAITVPVLILDGAKEELIDLNQTKLMALLIPGAELAIMPDTGHFAMFEQPDEFNAIVLDYLGT